MALTGTSILMTPEISISSSHEVFILLSSKNVIVLGLMLWSLIQLDLIFVYGVR